MLARIKFCNSYSPGQAFHFLELDLGALAKPASVFFFIAELGLSIMGWVQPSTLPKAHIQRPELGFCTGRSTWQCLIESSKHILLWALLAACRGSNSSGPYPFFSAVYIWTHPADWKLRHFERDCEETLLANRKWPIGFLHSLELYFKIRWLRFLKGGMVLVIVPWWPGERLDKLTDFLSKLKSV